MLLLSRSKYIAPVAILVLMICGIFVPSKTYAATTLAESNYSTSGSVSFSTAATAGDLLVAICSSNGAYTLTAPSGFSTAINEASDPSQAIFYKVAAGGETTISCTYSGGTDAIQIIEFSGIENVSPLDVVNTVTSSGSSSIASSGSLTNNNYNDLLIAGITSDTNTSPSGWTNSFTQMISTSSGGKPSTRMAFGSAYFTVNSPSSYSTSATVASGYNWRGQIAAFKIAPSPVFSGDIVNSSGTSITSPTVSLTALNQSFSCQTATGVLGTSSQQIRITNTEPSDNLGWNLTIAASSSSWSDGSGQNYAYNNASGSPAGCTAGQLTISPASQVITPETSPEYGCTNTGLSAGADSAMTGTTPVTITSASSSASYYCYWDITNIGLSQAVPSMQPAGSYSLSLTLTLTAL